VNARESLARLRALGIPFFRTSDAAAAWQQTNVTASQTLGRLAESGLVTSVRHGAWWIGDGLDPYRLPEFLTNPQPSYVSVHSALYLHGVIEQIPAMVYVVTLARTQRIRTTAGTFSLHHLAPEVFGGYEEGPTGVKLATVEKALFDFAYLSPGRSRRFTSLPEVELPRGFRRAELQRWLRRIASTRTRTLTERALAGLL
jgi:predicted transcriptional regulator of viral defense system